MTATATRVRRVYVPAGIDKEPTTPREALLSAAALLEEEGRWAQGVFYRNKAQGTDEYVDNPWCNGWGTCAVGALQCVTLGVTKCTAINYRGEFDQTRGCWPTHEVWSAPEDEYSLAVDGYLTPGEWAELDASERLYVRAHRLLDVEAKSRGADGAISLNDAEETTRDAVIAMFRGAAERPESDGAILGDDVDG